MAHLWVSKALLHDIQMWFNTRKDRANG